MVVFGRISSTTVESGNFLALNYNLFFDLPSELDKGLHFVVAERRPECLGLLGLVYACRGIRILPF